MKKIAVLWTAVVLSLIFPICANAIEKITKPQIVQATESTTVTYSGIPVFVPAGQTVILGSYSKGAISLRGQNLNGVKVGDGTIAASGPVILSIQPTTQVVQIEKGNNIKITDKNGRTAELSTGATVSMKDVRKSGRTSVPAQAVSVAQTKKAVPATKSKHVIFDDDTNAEIFAFVAAAEASAAALEQKVQKNGKVR